MADGRRRMADGRRPVSAADVRTSASGVAQKMVEKPSAAGGNPSLPGGEAREATGAARTMSRRFLLTSLLHLISFNQDVAAGSGGNGRLGMLRTSPKGRGWSVTRRGRCGVAGSRSPEGRADTGGGACERAFAAVRNEPTAADGKPRAGRHLDVSRGPWLRRAKPPEKARKATRDGVKPPRPRGASSWSTGAGGAPGGPPECEGRVGGAGGHRRLISSSRWKTISFGRSPASFRNSSSWLSSSALNASTSTS